MLDIIRIILTLIFGSALLAFLPIVIYVLIKELNPRVVTKISFKIIAITYLICLVIFSIFFFAGYSNNQNDAEEKTYQEDL